MAIGRLREALLGILAVLAGWTIAFVDSRPGWDDSGISAGLLVLAAFLVATASGRRPWLWALLIGIWTPLLEIAATGAIGPMVALAFAAIGASVGYLVARSLPRRGVD